jgi:hypothetical protein
MWGNEVNQPPLKPWGTINAKPCSARMLLDAEAFDLDTTVPEAGDCCLKLAGAAFHGFSAKHGVEVVNRLPIELKASKALGLHVHPRALRFVVVLDATPHLAEGKERARVDARWNGIFWDRLRRTREKPNEMGL